MKKVAPIILLVIMAVAALAIKRCNSNVAPAPKKSTNQRNAPRTTTAQPPANTDLKLDRNTTDLFFTKHARCRMSCRHITQQEVKDILANGTVNYNKSDLQDPRGPTYALEGYTRDRQHVRIIFSPHQQHLTVVTVIDLDVEHECSCP